MTIITLDLPEDLATRLAPLRDQLPQILTLALDLYVPVDSGLDTLAYSPAMGEVIDFLAGSPTPEEIIDFKLGVAAQTRLEELLDKNREGILTPEETAELDTYQQINHLLILLKARARKLV